jgi:hypothetical protein
VHDLPNFLGSVPTSLFFAPYFGYLAYTSYLNLLVFSFALDQPDQAGW